MYDAVDLYVSQTLPRHYESDEEDISESEGHSPLDHKRSATLDSIMSVEEPVEPAFPRLLSPFPSNKTSRPVSMDTVKRSSSATFVTEPCTIFDHDDEMIIELPSPDNTTPLQSPIFLQPSVYVPSEPLTSPRHSFSSSSGSVYSDDESDVFVAEQVTYVEHAKPSLISISPTSSQDPGSPLPSLSPTSDSSGSVYSNDGAAKSQPLLGETCMDRGRSRFPPRPIHSKAQGSLSALDTLRQASRPPPTNEPMSAPAIDAPRPSSFRARSMSFSRPQTPVTDRRRLQKEPPRPPSAQSTATFSLFPTQSQTQTQSQRDESRTRSISTSHSAASSTYSLSLSSQPTSRTASPRPYSPAPAPSSAYNRSRSGSLYSVSSMSRPPLPYRGSLIKSSTMGGYSSSNLRAEINESAVDRQVQNQRERAQSGPAPQSTTDDLRSKAHRKKSLKQLSPGSGSSSKDRKETGESTPTSSAKSFVGFMFGKRKSVVK